MADDRFSLGGTSLLAKLGPEPVITSAVAGAVGLFNGGLLAGTRSCEILHHQITSYGQPGGGGVGNIYANEALFRAGIRPSRLAGKISLARYERLAGCVQRVLEEAIQQGRDGTLKDFTDSLGRPGYFQPATAGLWPEGDALYALWHAGPSGQPARPGDLLVPHLSTLNKFPCKCFLIDSTEIPAMFKEGINVNWNSNYFR